MAIIEVKNLGKKYKISHRAGGYLALRDVLTNIFRNPFKFLKQKAKQVAGVERSEEFWALKDVNFTVEKGEVVGIIGANGAGKSTLLKILSQITPPTTGEIKINGRVGSLLEVGTGFHSELSGRENIYLNGAILGMTKVEITKKFDEIVAFSGVEKFLDTPVKYYSSGMYVRLAFAVAAHMDPEILIVDEVLAVGDAEFQKKCLGKMDEITKKEGRTILFVSHNMEAIKQLCGRCVLLDNGGIKKIGKTGEVIDFYLNNHRNFKPELFFPATNKNEAEITSIKILKNNNELASEIYNNEDFLIEVEFNIYSKINAILCFSVFLNDNYYFISAETDKLNPSDKKLINYSPGSYRASILVNKFILIPNSYELELSLQVPFDHYVDKKRGVYLEILEKNIPHNVFWSNQKIVKCSPVLNFDINKIC